MSARTSDMYPANVLREPAKPAEKEKREILLAI
jgi:hypothetical protein